jgi:hypothetical protein
VPRHDENNGRPGFKNLNAASIGVFPYSLPEAMKMVAQLNHAATERIWGRIIARAWTDEDFKQRLTNDPRTVFAENGIDVETDAVRDFVLPPPPADELTDEPLTGNEVAYCYSGYCGRCGCGCRACRCF